jgi:large conductance mechanosensitive channel
VYFVVFMAVVYFVIVVPYRRYMARRGTTVFGAPTASKECPSCLSAGLPLAATTCRYCSSEIPVA